ncbi:MAG: D-alanyl-D-alanine carboxypeptidase [Armatimonadota bacterium]|jgi:D-alanyl-D-alanine carboxypeptidase/D-alanyl-D-alanine-endopeptidase (penicillin-binding protein 4)
MHTRDRIMRRSAIVCMLVAALALGGSPARSGAESLREVQNRVAGVLAHPALRGAEVGALVVSLDRGDEIYRLDSGRPLIPASNMKLVTIATALELLGPTHDCSAVPGAKPGEALAALAHRILKPSDNALSQALLEALPEAAGRPDLTPRQLCAEVWAERGLFLHGARWADGSGLSRNGLMSAGLIVDLLRTMDRSRWRETFIEAQPVAGVDGTLRRRMQGGRAEGRVRAKTGSLTGVSALSGYAETVSGERLVFAMVMNGFECEVARVRRMQDDVCEALVGLEREGAASERATGH